MYQIVSSCPAHDGPVKTLSVHPGGAGMMASGGQDSAVRQWLFDGTALNEASSPLHHSHWITALTHLPPNCLPSFPNGLIVTACMDNVIRLYDHDDTVRGNLVGHQKSVISFSWTEEYNMVSGSWDGTARVWDIESSTCLSCFDGHENGVHVLCLPQGLVATVSTGEQVNGRPANFKLRIWSISSGQMVQSPIDDHDGPIRSIFRVPDIGFGTTSNDGSVRLRSCPDGQCISVCHHPIADEGFPPFVLAGTALALPGGAVGSVTCGEDGSVMVWNGPEVLQAIPHPCCVWDVCALRREDGQPADIVTAGHDGFIRVFSCAPTLKSSAAALQLQDNFNQEVRAAVAARRQGPSAEEVAQYPRWEDRGTVRGDSEGQVKVFGKDSMAVAAQWDGHAGTWLLIGEVTGRGGAADGGMLNGQSYDHIMPVEIETSHGVVELKLGYNDAESQYAAAQRFIDDNMLDQNYLRQIADFIAARRGQPAAPTLDMSGVSGGVVAPPLASPAAQSPSRPKFHHLPSRIFFSFDDVPASSAKILSKIVEFNTTHLEDRHDGSAPSSREGALSASDLSSLSDLLDVLADKSHYHSSTVGQSMLSPLLKMATHWSDEDSLFPCFDLLRMVANHPSGAQTLARSHACQTVLNRAIATLQHSSSAASPSSAQSLTALRFLVNGFRHDDLRRQVVQFLSAGKGSDRGGGAAGYLAGALAGQVASPKKTHRHSTALLLHNVLLAHCASSQTAFQAAADLFCPCAALLLAQETENADTVLKCLLGVGSVLVTALEIFPSAVSSLSCLTSPETDLRLVLERVRALWENRSEDIVLNCLQEIEGALLAIQS